MEMNGIVGVTVPSGSAMPRPSDSAGALRLNELCREFDRRGDRAAQIKALDDQHFGELVRQAGKKDHDRVVKFCAGVRPSGAPSGHPSGSAVPGGPLPSDLPSTRPGDQPAPRSGERSGYPSDRPSPFPSGSAVPRAQG